MDDLSFAPRPRVPGILIAIDIPGRRAGLPVFARVTELGGRVRVLLDFALFGHMYQAALRAGELSEFNQWCEGLNEVKAPAWNLTP